VGLEVGLFDVAAALGGGGGAGVRAAGSLAVQPDTMTDSPIPSAASHAVRDFKSGPSRTRQPV
jgi:hypothetical protein